MKLLSTSLSSTLPTPRTILTIGALALMVLWNAAAHDNLTHAVGTAYVALAVLTFTLAWVIALAYGIWWVMRLVERGEEAEKLDLVKAAQGRL